MHLIKENQTNIKTIKDSIKHGYSSQQHTYSYNFEIER